VCVATSSKAATATELAAGGAVSATCSMVCNEAGTRWYYYDDNEAAQPPYGGCNAFDDSVTIPAGQQYVQANCTPNTVVCGYTWMAGVPSFECTPS
jgi:hypothetical protein